MFKLSKGVKAIFYINIAMFLLSIVLAVLNIPILNYLSFWGWDQPYFFPTQFITYQFLHANLMHILFNMITFISIAPSVESYFSTNRFYIYYLTCGVFSAVLHTIMVGNEDPLVGASGSVFGMLSLFGLLMPNVKLSILFLPIGIKAKYIIISLFLIEIVSTFISHDNVSHWGHIGGFLTGSLIFLYEKYLAKNVNICRAY